MFEEQKNGFNSTKIDEKFEKGIINKNYSLILSFRKDNILINEIVKFYKEIKNIKDIYNLDVSQKMEFHNLKEKYISMNWKTDFLNQYPNLVINAGQLK